MRPRYEGETSLYVPRPWGYTPTMNLTPDDLEMVVRLVAALVAGAVIGYERSFHGRPAGFRTHALVCMASSLLMLVTVYEAHWVQTDVESIRLDPTRMAQGIMTGIGFLGAGVIMRDGINVKGLSTAATVWCTGAVGVMAGSGFLLFSLLATVLIILCNLCLPPLARLIYRFVPVELAKERYYMVEVIAQAQQEALVRTRLLQSLSSKDLTLQSLESHALKTGGQVEVNAVVLALTQQDSQLESLVGELALAPYVTAVSWSVAEE